MDPSQRLFGIEVRHSDTDAQRGIERSATRGLNLLGLALLLFFAVLLVVAVLREQSRHDGVAETQAAQDVAQAAAFASGTLGQQVAWLDTAAGLQSPSRQVELAARGNGVAAAALLDGEGRVVAVQPDGARDTFATLQGSVRSDNAVDILSVTAANGQTNPVVSRAVPQGRLMVALAPGALAPSTDDTLRLVMSPTGRLIDAPQWVGREGGPVSALGVSRDALARLTQTQDTSTRDVRGQKSWVGSARIPNTDLSVVRVQAWQRSPRIGGLVILVGALFIGTGAVIATMVSTLLRHINQAQTAFDEDEVANQRYQAAIDGTGGGVFEIDLETDEVYLSSNTVRMLGLGDEERILPFPQFLGLFHDADRERLYHQVRRAHMSGEFEVDLQVRHIPIVVSCRAKPLMRSGDDETIPTRKFIVGLALDITEARGAQLRLQAAEARLFDALSSMSDAFVIWDQRDRLVLWNRRFEDFFGFVPGNLTVGLAHATVEYHAQNAVEDTSQLDDGTGSEILLRDGRWIRYLETPTKDGGRVSIGTEVTQIRSREEELRRNQATLTANLEALRETQLQLVELAQNYEVEKIRAEEANQSKSEFLANMSHELRTPLNAINGFSDIMVKEMFGPMGDPRYSEYVSDILFSGRHLLSLINDILDMSKIEAGKMTLNIDRLLVDDMVQQVIRILRGRAEDNRLKLVYTPSAMDPIEADPRAIKQILLNLVTNAIKFTPEGGVVRVECEPRSTGVIVRVSDSGMGISEDDLARLAQPFEQASNNMSGEGTGLGLALSKSLVELHGGNFAITSTLGEGTTVTFTLPNSPVPQDADAPATTVSDEITRIASTISDALRQGAEATGQPQPPVAQLPPAA